MSDEVWVSQDELELPRAICPDCRDNKHNACVGSAWDYDLDLPAICRCWELGHEE